MDLVTLVESLRATSAMLARLLGRADLTLFVQDRELRYLLVQCLSSATERAVLGHTDDEYLPPEAAAPLMALKRSVIASGTGVRQRVALPLHGDVRHYELTLEPICEASGRPAGILGLVFDSTQQVRTAAALDNMRSRLQALMNALPVGVSFSEDVSCHRITGNPTLLRQFDASGLDNLSASAPDAGASGRQVRFVRDGCEVRAEDLPLQRAVAENRVIDPVEMEVVLPNGRRWMAEITGAPVHDDAGKVVGGVAVTVDVTRRQHTETMLREADRRKDEFLATLAHELRNPLAPIRHAVEAMKQAPDNPDVLTQARCTIERQVMHMTRLIDDLIDISRIRRNTIELNRQALDISQVLTETIDSCRAYLDKAQHRLHLDLPPEPLPVSGDSVRLHQVFTNIVINACKYTPRGGNVSIVARREADEVVVTVRDDGIGIAADVLPAVFDLFLRIDNPSIVVADGLGIGLSLVKRFVDMHGGSVTASSDGPGRGTCLTVRLPALEAGVGPSRTPVPSLLAPTRCRRVLVVDDNEDGAESLAMLLQLSGHEAEVAFDGEQALSRLEHWMPDVILLDLGLPGMSGLDLCRAIRLRSPPERPLIVALTGRGHEDDRRRTVEAGFDAHVVKPVDPGMILKLISADVAEIA